MLTKAEIKAQANVQKAIDTNSEIGAAYQRKCLDKLTAQLGQLEVLEVLIRMRDK